MRLPVEASAVVAQLAKDIPGLREERKAFALLLRGLGSLFECTKGTLFLYRRATATLHKVTSLREAESWDMDTVMQFYLNEKPELKSDIIMAPVRVGEHVVGVLALSKSPGFERGAGKVATEVLRIAGRMLGGRRHVALLQSESAIAGAVLNRLRPKDIVYRIFHALRRFIDYDHGATLLVRTGDTTASILARQTAWAPGKSDIVGKTVAFPWEALPEGGECFIVSDSAGALGEALFQIREEGSPPKLSLVAGTLAEDGAQTGCVEVASTRANFFVDKDPRVLRRFLPYICWCLSELMKTTGGCHE